MSKLTAAKKKAEPQSDFGLPKERKYPMPDASHARNAKARASQMEHEGKLSARTFFECQAPGFCLCRDLCYKQCVTEAKPKIKSVRLFVKPWCGWCRQAAKWLDAKGIQYETLDVTADAAADREMQKLSGQDLAPVIEVDGQILADFDVEQLAEFWKRFE